VKPDGTLATSATKLKINRAADQLIRGPVAFCL
jgi:hypothetical protein